MESVHSPRPWGQGTGMCSVVLVDWSQRGLEAQVCGQILSRTLLEEKYHQQRRADHGLLCSRGTAVEAGTTEAVLEVATEMES